MSSAITGFICPVCRYATDSAQDLLLHHGQEHGVTAEEYEEQHRHEHANLSKGECAGGEGAGSCDSKVTGESGGKGKDSASLTLLPHHSIEHDVSRPPLLL